MIDVARVGPLLYSFNLINFFENGSSAHWSSHLLLHLAVSIRECFEHWRGSFLADVSSELWARGIYIQVSVWLPLRCHRSCTYMSSFRTLTILILFVYAWSYAWSEFLLMLQARWWWLKVELEVIVAFKVLHVSMLQVLLKSLIILRWISCWSIHRGISSQVIGL